MAVYGLYWKKKKHYCSIFIQNEMNLKMLFKLQSCTTTSDGNNHKQRVFFLPTDSGNRRSSLIKHSHGLGQQQLGFGDNCEDAQDVKGITYRVTPAGRGK